MSYTIIEKITEEQRKETLKRKDTISSISSRLETELQSRDLKDIPTEKLVQLIVLLNKQVDIQNVLINEKKYQSL